MKLLSVIHGPAFGGAHNQLVRLAGPLAARGVETVALLPEEATEAAERIRSSGLEVLTMPLGRLRAVADPREQARFARDLPRDVRAISRAVRRIGADVVQTHGPTNPQAAVAARGAGRAVVWQLLDTRAPMPLRLASMPLILRLADAVTVWGKALLREHPGTGLLGDRVLTVFPPVDVSSFASDPARIEAAKRALALPVGTLAVGTVGVLNPQKGHEHLLAAVATLRRERRDVAIRILGAPSPAHGAYRRRLELDAAKLASDDPGPGIRDPGGEVADLIQGFDVFVMASVRRSEGMPTALLEAMAASKPVIATDVGAVRELVDDGVSGLIVEPDDPRTLVAALRRLLDDERLRQSMGAAGRRIAVERFDLERLSQRHLHAYEIALRHRHGRD